MKKTQFISKPNFKFSKDCCERVSKASSQTVQGAAYTIPQLFARFAAGDTSIRRKDVAYSGDDPDFDDTDFDQLSRADLEDRYAVMKESQELLDKLDAARRAAVEKRAEADAAKIAKQESKSESAAKADKTDASQSNAEEGEAT